ncbi:hypothetical protein cand_000560 [Cryptosporidium andersoni]|uniref:Uncharacterized protein n=1 Tax=Cryptosporidium andersoni TaxID=117008 RepID=A0A1J4MR51_9CRYT|nr:hypothetical protein cand_000560 [Cryptosporidium andersoni]
MSSKVSSHSKSLKNKINSQVYDYFRKSLQVTSTNLSDTNLPFPYKHEMLSGLNIFSALISDPDIINVPIPLDVIIGYYPNIFDNIYKNTINILPRHDTGFSIDLMNSEAYNIDWNRLDRGSGVNRDDIDIEDLLLVDNESSRVFNHIVQHRREVSSEIVEENNESSSVSELDIPRSSTNEPILVHPNKPNVIADFILPIIPHVSANTPELFQVTLDSDINEGDCILELADEWTFPTTRFSLYKKDQESTYSYDRDYSCQLPRENYVSYIINLPREFLKGDSVDKKVGTLDRPVAHIMATKAPKLLLRKVSSTKKNITLQVQDNSLESQS